MLDAEEEEQATALSRADASKIIRVVHAAKNKYGRMKMKFTRRNFMFGCVNG